MHFNLISIFPEFFTSPLSTSLIKKAIEKGIISFSIVNPRDFATDTHKSVDDRPYGGGPGMVMMADPICRAIEHIEEPGKIILLSPRGKVFNQKEAEKLSREKTITFICGRYEGIDERVDELFEVEKVSIGDFVLNGGEAASLCMIEAICRFLPDFMGKEDSVEAESFSAGLIEHPHYTRPREYRGLKVPEVLLSGNHREIEKWRREMSLLETFKNRPELLENAPLLPDDYTFLRQKKELFLGRNLYVGLVHYPVVNREGRECGVSLTNLDIHDIARVCKTYGISRYYLITPIEDQKQLASRLISHWIDGPGKGANPDREAALKLISIVDSIEDGVEDIRTKTGIDPYIVTTSARDEGSFTFSGLREVLQDRPVFLLFGTGHGLSPRVMKMAHAILKPIRAFDRYRHLSVRSAVSIIIDRILKDIF